MTEQTFKIGKLFDGSGKLIIKNTTEYDVRDYARAQVVDNNLKASNIRKGINILGITGTVNEGINPSGTIQIKNTNLTDVKQYEKAQVIDNNLKPENIKKGTSILGINGNLNVGNFFIKNYLAKNGTTLQTIFKNYPDTNIDGLLMFDDTHNVINMSKLFIGCENLETVTLFDTSNCTNMSEMFSSCNKLKTIPLFNTSKVEYFNSMFNNCTSLITIPKLDTSNASSLSYMFNSCTSLKIIPELDCSKLNFSGLMNTFMNCTNIEEINIRNINANLDISSCKKMQQPALHHLIDNLKEYHDTGLPPALTLGTTLLNRVSDEYKQIAQEKGWTIR